jgi:predicted small integral membrane protein
VTRPTLGALAITAGATFGTVALIVCLLTAWARCSDLGPRVEVLPVVLDAGARAR